MQRTGRSSVDLRPPTLPPAQSAWRAALLPGVLGLVLLGGLAGCGQKGPLTLPAAPAPAAAASAP